VPPSLALERARFGRGRKRGEGDRAVFRDIRVSLEDEKGVKRSACGGRSSPAPVSMIRYQRRATRHLPLWIYRSLRRVVARTSECPRRHDSRTMEFDRPRVAERGDRTYDKWMTRVAFAHRLPPVRRSGTIRRAYSEGTRG